MPAFAAQHHPPGAHGKRQRQQRKGLQERRPQRRRIEAMRAAQHAQAAQAAESGLLLVDHAQDHAQQGDRRHRHHQDYQPSADEVARFEAACARRLPLLIKGPTGCGKTRFVEYMAWRLQRPLVNVVCHEDLSAGDLVGRWLLDAGGTRWQDGPLTLAARHGAICYLDELVEARADTTVVIHPLTDTRRMLPLAQRNELVHAHADFQLVVSCNPRRRRVS